MIRPCSTHDSTLFDSIDPVRLYRPVRLMFRPVRLMVRRCSTHDSTLFDYSVRSTVLICDENRTLFDRVGRIMSRTPQPGFESGIICAQIIVVLKIELRMRRKLSKNEHTHLESRIFADQSPHAVIIFVNLI